MEHPVEFGPIAKVGSEVLSMTQVEAIEYCKDQGRTLPTIRQLSELLNPEGVSDSAHEGAVKISPRGEDAFYYDYRTFKRPPMGESGLWFWSSSLHSDFNQAYYNGYNLGLGRYSRGDDFAGNKGAVRCVYPSAR